MADVPLPAAIPGLPAGWSHSLRNGAATTMSPPSRAAAIPDAYHWAKVEGVESIDACNAIELFIRSAYARVMYEPASAEWAAFVAICANATPPTAPARDVATISAHITAGSPAVRQTAILLGASRAGLVGLYAPTGGEFVAAESWATTVYRWTPAVRDPDGTITTAASVALHSGRTAEQLGVAEALALGMAGLTADEVELAWLAYRMAAASAPLAGLSLLNTNHHYLSSETRATNAVKSQLFKEEKAEAVAAWKSDDLTSNDVVFHKACHPLSADFLKGLATDAGLPERLQAIGLGSAAVRLPHCSAALRAAKAYLALVNGVKVTTAMAGYTISLPMLSQAVTVTEHYPATGVQPAPHPLAPTVRDLKTAIKSVLEPAMASAAPIVAAAAGIYKAQSSEAEMAGGRDTLLSAYSVKKAMASNVGAVAAGKLAYDLYARFSRRLVDGGQLPALHVTDATGLGEMQAVTTNAALPAIAPAPAPAP